MNGTQVVAITGASAGVGRATARAFARRGTRLGLLARGQDRLEATHREVEALGGQALVVPCDVAHSEQVEAAAAQVEEALGPIDVWVNNATTTVFSPLLDLTAEEFRRVTEVTYLGCVHGTLAALRRMVPRNRGRVIQVGSALAYRGIPLQSAYCGAKHAIQGFTESVRSELIHDKSRVTLTMIQLPALNTPQFRWCRSHMPRKARPVPPIFQPEVAADAIVWAADNYRREIDVGFSTAWVVAANKFVPGLGDYYLASHGYEGQMTNEPETPGRPDNLWTPVPGEVAARGDFSGCARESSWQFWATTHRGLLAGLAIGGLALAALAGGRRRSMG